MYEVSSDKITDLYNPMVVFIKAKGVFASGNNIFILMSS